MDTSKSQPGGRAGHSDVSRFEATREKALDRITTAYAKGDMTLEEYERKATAIQKATALAEIDAQLPDLPAEAPVGEARSGARPVPSPRGDFRIEERHGKPEFTLCVMGERKYRGDWLDSDQASSLTLMGSTVYDFRDTALPPGKIRIEAMAIMGEVKIIVPPGLPVRMTAFPLMGEASVQASVDQRPRPGEPWVEVSGMAIMGSIVVKMA